MEKTKRTSEETKEKVWEFANRRLAAFGKPECYSVPSEFAQKDEMAKHTLFYGTRKIICIRMHKQARPKIGPCFIME